MRPGWPTYPFQAVLVVAVLAVLTTVSMVNAHSETRHGRDAAGSSTSVVDRTGPGRSAQPDRGALRFACALSPEPRLTEVIRRSASASGAGYTYNSLGQLTEETRTTPGGTSTSSVAYSYDGAGRTATESRDGEVTRYAYDGDGRRVSAIGPSETSRYSYDPRSHQLLAEHNGDDELIADYLLGLGQISRTTYGVGGTSTSYHHADAQRNVRALTDADGVTTHASDFEPFGIARVSSAASPSVLTAQPYGFAGEFTEPGAATMHLRARQYDPTTGRFTAPDPLGGPGATSNYTYGHNNPMAYGDPSGLWPDLSGLANAVVGAAPILTTVATVATFTPLAPIAGFFALAGGAVMAADAAVTAHSSCASGKGACGEAVINAAVSTAMGVGAGKLVHRAVKLARGPAANAVDDILPTPQVSSQGLQNHIDALYKGTGNPNRVGNGTTMDAIRNELATGAPTAGRMHAIKGQERLNGLNNWLRRNPGAHYHDRLVAQSLADELGLVLRGGG